MAKRLEERLKYLAIQTKPTIKQGKTSKFSHIEPNKVIDLLHQGLRLPHIAAIYGCSPQTIPYQVRKTYPDFDARKHIQWGRYDIKVEEVVELYEKIGNVNKIADRYGVNTHAITERLEKAGVKRRPLYRGDIKKENVVALYRILKSTGKVAEKLGINISLVRKRLREAGLSDEEIIKNRSERNKQRRRTDISEKQVLRMYDNKKSVKAIARKFKASQGAIDRILRENKGK